MRGLLTADQACLRLRLPDSVRESAHKLWTVEVVRQVWVELPATDAR